MLSFHFENSLINLFPYYKQLPKYSRKTPGVSQMAQWLGVFEIKPYEPQRERKLTPESCPLPSRGTTIWSVQINIQKRKTPCLSANEQCPPKEKQIVTITCL